MKNFKKVLSVLLMMVMVLSMCITASAAKNTETKLTIYTEAGHEYAVYQMLIGDVSGLTDGEGTLADVEAGANLAGTVEAFDEALVAEVKADGTKVYKTGSDLSAAALSKIADPEAPMATVTGNDAPQVVDVVEGYYVVIDSYEDSGVAKASYMVAVVGPTNMYPKATTTDIDKVITDTDGNAAIDDSKKTDTAAIGDEVEFMVTGKVPVTAGYNYFIYQLTDTMSKGLTFNNNVVVKIGVLNDQKVFVEDPAAVTLEAGADKDYVLTGGEKAEDGTTTFTIAFNDMKTIGLTKAGYDIVVTYSATINEDCEVGVIPNTNDVELTYSNDPDHEYVPGDENDDDVTGKTPKRTTKTYVTELTLQKTDGTAFVDDLAAATFTLTGTGMNTVKVLTQTVFVEDTQGTYYKLKDGTYTETVPSDLTADQYESTSVMYKTVTTVDLLDAEDSGKEVSIEAIVNEAGQIVFRGLTVGEYTLEETNTPVGYNTCDPIEFEITASLVPETSTAVTGGLVDWASDNAAVAESMKDGAALGVFEVTVVNEAGNLLPATGGRGTVFFYVIGAVLALGAGVVLVARKRMAK